MNNNNSHNNINISDNNHNNNNNDNINRNNNKQSRLSTNKTRGMSRSDLPFHPTAKTVEQHCDTTHEQSL